MKKLFKKAMTVAGSVALIGATVGSAFAASYPEPFTSNTAIVVGASAAPSDNVAAANIASDLDSESAGTTTTTVEGGETFDLFDNDYLHFGDAMNAVKNSALDDDDMDALADGEYDDGDTDDLEYTQRVSIGSKALELIADSDLNDEEPTIGYHFDDTTVLTYTLDFESDGANMTTMAESDFPLFGETYYVLEADSTNKKITLLNSAEKTIVSEGETITVDGHSVSMTYITDTYVKFNVDGEETDKLADGDDYKLDDDYYIVLSENLYTDKDGAVSKAEFSLGSGKVVLENDTEVEVNDDSIDGLTATVSVTGDGLTDLVLTWATDGEVFLTEGNSIEMPVFGAFSVLFDGVDFGDTSEDISLENGQTLTLSMGNYDVDVMHNESGTWNIGGDGHEIVTISSSAGTSKTFAIAKDERFLATKLDTDLADVDTAYYEVQSLNNDTAQFDLKLDDLTDDNDDMEWTDADAGDDDDKGDINVQVDAVYDSGATVSSAHNASYSGAGYVNASSGKALMDFAILTVSSDTSLQYDTVVSEEGLVVRLPTTAAASQEILFYEAADDGDLDTDFGVPTLNLSVGNDADEDLYATVVNDIMVDKTQDNQEMGYTSSIHAIMVEEDTDTRSLDMEYHADEVTVDLKLVYGGETSTSESGVMTVTDSQVSSVSGKNLIVVGGSAINSVAAELLGGAYAGEEFTAMTGVADGEFLIQSFDRSGKTALLVAGYNAEDTTKATTYLLNNDVDTSVGTKMKGTSATEATVVTA